MALTLPTATRNAACNAVVDLMDSGTTLGKLKIYTTGLGVLLVTNLFSNPAFGGASTGVATAAAIANGTAVATNTAAEAKMTNGADTDIITGLVVGAGSGDINLNSVSITSGDVVSITSMTVTMPAS
jgi:hypothetical protein